MRQRRNKFRHFEHLETRRLLAFDSLVISEFMAANDSTLADEDGEFSDWLEIHNPTSEDISLQGWSLTDDADEPGKWPLPPVQLESGGFQIVFASGKDRGFASEELHSNFRLRGSGEYLAIVGPEGVTHEYSPEYPRQSSDVAFGLVIDQTPLTESSYRFRVPTEEDAALGTAWTNVEFDDSDWREVDGAVGYELRGGIPNVGFEQGDFEQWGTRGGAEVVTSDVGVTPTQGDKQAILRTFEDAPTRFTLESFLGLDRFALDDNARRTVTRGSVLRREVTVEAGSQIEFDWNFLTDEPTINGFDDFAFASITPGIGLIELAGVPDANLTSTSSFARESGYRHFTYTFEEAGTYTLGLGTVNVSNRFNDSGLLIDNLLIDGVGSLADTFDQLIDSDVESELSGLEASAWMRHEFDVPDPDQFASLVIDARFDDGLVAHLNGVEVARRNAPNGVQWNSLAAQARPDSLAFESDLITIPAAELKTGKNVLAVQGLKESSTDESFLMQVGLVGISQLNETPAYLPVATPGLPNLTNSFRAVEQVQFSAEHGFYEAAFDLTLTSATPDAEIVFTTDGSTPTLEDGLPYEGPLNIDSGTVIRAAAFRDGFSTSPISTRSYLFVDDVLTQSRGEALSRGFPTRWGAEVADYEVDQRIAGQNGADRFGGRYADTIRDDLKSVPTLSLVMEMDDLFGAEGIYSNPTQRGVEWERPTSIELIDPAGGEGFQIDAGIRIQGGISRFISSKSSLRLLFKEEYGASKLEYPLFGPENASTFDSVSLRSSSGEHLIGIHYIRDEFLRRSQLQTGNLSSHGTYMHLFINGLYWGMYNPVERIDGQFAANYFGGEKEDYDVLNAGDLGQEGVSAVIGSLDAWNTMVDLSRDVSRARTQEDRTAAFLRLQGLNPDGSRNDEWEVYLDVENYVDYLITNVYARNDDWPIRNYYMSRKLGPDSSGFQFYVWDAEFTLDRGTKTSITQVNSDGPGIVYQLLKDSEAFRVAFSDRVQIHFSEGGAYYVNPENAEFDPENPQDNVPASLYLDVANEVASPIVPETARWGDERGRQGPLFTRDEQWVPLINANLGTFFPTRSEVFLRDLRRNEYYRDAPVFSQPTGGIEVGQQVEIEANSGQVYYTLDGTDPRNADGSIAASAVRRDSLVIDQRTVLRARSLDGDEWSAISSVEYFTDALPADATNLRIVELNYNPHDALTQFGELDVDNDEFEFIELVNVGTRPVDLAGAKFVQVGGEGIEFEFGTQVLAPEQRVVVVKNRDAFVSRFDSDVLLAQGISDSPEDWVYEGRLANGGERITLVDARGGTISQFQYDDSGDWPGRADGNGSSLEVVDPMSNLDDPANFRNSSELGGSPGVSGQGPDNRVVINEVLANSGASADKIELLNTTSEPIDISGWYLTDSNADLVQYKIPNGTSLASNGFLVLDDREFAFGLSSVRGDDVYLLDSDSNGRPLRFVDRVEFGASDIGTSFGRWPDADGRLFPMESTSFGEANTGPLAPTLVVSEIHYEPRDPDDNGPLTGADFEYVELFNSSDSAIDLRQYSLDGSVELSFAEESQLEPGASIVAVKFDPSMDDSRSLLFRLAYGIDTSVRLAGPMTGTLGNDAGVVRVERELMAVNDPEPSRVLIDRVAYQDSASWPSDLIGTGQSLTRLAPDAYGDFSSSWTSLRRSPGVTEFNQFSPGDVNRDGLVNVEDIDQLCTGVRQDSSEARFDLNRDGQIDHADFLVLTTDILGIDPGDANLDGIFNSSDFVQVFRAAEYEDDVAENSTWGEGDWNCDGEFDTSDFVVAFQSGGYSSFDLAVRVATVSPLPWPDREGSDLSDREPSDQQEAKRLGQVTTRIDERPNGRTSQLVALPTERTESIFAKHSQAEVQVRLKPLDIDRFFERQGVDEP